MSAHTPTPWEVIETKNDGDYGDGGPDSRSGFDSFAICDVEGRVICDTLNSDARLGTIVEESCADEDGYVHAWDEVGKANAEHIVHCVNAHDELVAALRELAEAEWLDDDHPRLIAARGQARTALAKVSA